MGSPDFQIHVAKLIDLLTNSSETTPVHTANFCLNLIQVLDPDQIRRDFEDAKRSASDVGSTKHEDWYKMQIRLCQELFVQNVSVLADPPGVANLSRDFGVWFLSRLLRVATIDQTFRLSELLSDCWIAFIKSLSLKVRKEIISSMISFLSGLCSRNLLIEETIGIPCLLLSKEDFPVSFNVLDDDTVWTVKLEDSPFVLPDLETCEKLQSLLCSLLIKCDVILRDYPSSFYLILWDKLLWQLEYGGVELKRQSLSLFLLLFKINKTSPACLQYCFDVAFALFKSLIVNFQQVAGDKVEELQQHLIDFLNYFIKYLHYDLEDSPFLLQTVDFFVDLSDRCVDLLIHPDIVHITSSMTVCLINIMIGIYRTIEVFPFTDLSLDQVALIRRHVGRIFDVCLTNEYFFNFSEVPVLLAVFKTPDLANFALSEFTNVADNRYLSLRQLYVETFEKVVQHLASCFSSDLKEFDEEEHSLSGLALENFSKKLLKEVATLCYAFGFINSDGNPDFKTWIRYSERHLISFYATNPCSDSGKMLKIYAITFKTNRNSLIAKNISHILWKMSKVEGMNRLKEVMEFVETQSGGGNGDKLEFTKLVSSDRFNCIAELVTHFGVKERYVKEMLNQILPNASGVDCQHSAVCDSTNFSNELSSCFFGIVIRFEEKLRFHEYSKKEKLEAIKSFGYLLENFCNEKILGDAKLKALSVLMLASNCSPLESDFIKACASLWLAFLRKLDVNDLKTVCLQTCLSLIPYIENSTNLCLPAYDFMCNSNKMSLSEHLGDFEYLLTTPEMDAFRQVQKTHDSERRAIAALFNDLPSNRLNVRDSLVKTLHIVRHESHDVKIFGLKKLEHVLRTDLNDVYKLILGAEAVDSVIPKLMEYLLTLIGHNDETVRRLAAVCLGELGAIDPGRLQSKSICLRKHVYAFVDFSSTYNTEFVVRLLIELSNCLLSSSVGSSYNVFSYVIQQTLIFFDCRPDGETQSSFSEAVFKCLPPNVSAIVKPFLSTHYVIRRTENDKNGQPFPIINNCVSLKHWLNCLLHHLISKIKDSKPADLFQPLALAAECDLNIARYMLPHVVLLKLCDTDEITQNLISKEIDTVFVSCIEHEDGNSPNSFSKQAAQEIFALIDFLHVWLYENRHDKNLIVQRKRVESFLSSISSKSIIECANRCQAYTRALMVSEGTLKLKDCDESLQEIYANLGDTDAVTGILAIKKAKQLRIHAREEILAAECLGNYVEALPFYEQIIDNEPDNVKAHVSLIKCFLKLNQSVFTVHYLNGLLKEKPEAEKELQACRIETLCKLENWTSLEEELKKPIGVKTWGSDVATLLLAAKHKNFKDFSEKLRIVRDDLISRLDAVLVDSGAYDRTYKYIMRLHMLSEIENGVATFLNLKDNKKCNKTVDSVQQCWTNRLKVIRQSSETFNSVLDIRRHIYSLAKECNRNVTDLVNDSWLESLRIARKTGHLQSANNLLAKIKDFNLSETFEEEARLLWLKNEQDAATHCLRRGINDHYSEFRENRPITATEQLTKAFTKASLRYANFARESSAIEYNGITRLYEHLIRICPNQSVFYYLAVHFDESESTKASPDYEIRLKIVENYASSLHYGSKFLHNAMPRMLTLWLDSVSKIGQLKGDFSKKDHKNLEEFARRFNDLMMKKATALPPYQFYCSFSQLLSRIGSRSRSTVLAESTVDVLKEIISRCIVSYPQQCLWMSIAFTNARHEKPRTVCKAIYDKVVLKKGELKKLIDDFHKLVALLKQVCTQSVFSESISMKETFKELYGLFNQGKNYFSDIMIPLKSLLDVTLPTRCTGGTLRDESFNAFPSDYVYISSFENHIQVFSTLQKPKKMTMRGSDGQRYSVLCKTKDDLRLDKRVMEFTSLVNVFLLKDPEARRRQLNIRRYAVTPLGDDFGLLEWVENLEPIRTVLQTIYKEQKKGLPSSKLKDLFKKTDSDDKRLFTYKNELLPVHPAVFSLWFRRNFPDPTAWYLARQNYVRTAAVMSMVGFVLGLGDRHGENILMDTETGDAVHVDFNCLFNKGEELQVPELVPFRLTHNMIEAMGPLGYEGPFRKTCETTMRMMRNEKETLRTVLEAFLHDPVFDWTNPEQHAQTCLNNIDLRLKGCVRKLPILRADKNAYGSPLSVESQVANLIKHSTDECLLSKMYIGWGAYL